MKLSLTLNSFLITFICVFLTNVFTYGSEVIGKYDADNLLIHHYPGKGSTLPNKQQTDQAELKEKVKGHMQSQPVRFTENKGQMKDMNNNPVPFVLFKAEAPGMNVYITEKGLTYVFVKLEEEEHERENEREKGFSSRIEEEDIKTELAWVNVNLEGANIQRGNILKEIASSEYSNYFYGHCSEGISDVHHYEKITIKDVYPGIDWVFYNIQNSGMKYDFVVHPGADPSLIKLMYEGDKPLKLQNDGSISCKTKLGTLSEAKPYSYEEGDNKEIKSHYTLSAIDQNRTLLQYSIAQYNTSKTLIIDPQLLWGTFFGGPGYDGPYTIETDNAGNVYIAGYSISTAFPLQALPGAYFQSASGGATDAFIMKFSNNGALLWTTYYGGSGSEESHRLAIDGSNNIYMAGWTSSTNFPLQNLAGAYNQSVYGGGTRDAFLVKFSNSGTLQWATYYGGSGSETAFSLAIDVSNNVYMAGQTSSSTNFPLQNLGGAFNQSVYGGINDAFLVKFSNTGTLLWSTYYGGSGAEQENSVGIDGVGNVYIVGSTTSNNLPLQNLAGAYNQSLIAGSYDAFLVKFSPSGVRLWATYYGGSADDRAYSLAIDGSSNVYMTGWTTSTNFPLQNLAGAYNNSTLGGVRDVFLVKFSNTGSCLWATYYGGTSNEEFSSYDNIDIDLCGNVYITFNTESSNTPTQAWQASCGGFNDNTFGGGPFRDIFLVRFSNNGALTWATYIGGNGDDFRSPIALDNSGNLFISGEWAGMINVTTYPLVNPGGSTYYDGSFNGGEDGFILKFTPIIPTYSQSQVNPVACTNGVATVDVSCGDAPYTYQWSNGVVQTNVTNATSSISGLSPGTYQVTVTTNCNYSYTTNFTLTDPTCCSLPVTITPQQVSCFGGSNGQATANATGGTGTLTYLWSTTPAQTNQTATGLVAGNYNVTVTDGSGCTGTASVTITQPTSAVTVTTTSTAATCGSTNGTATANGTGGTGTITYSWNTTPAQTTATATGLGVGVYTVTATDANGCTATASTTVNNTGAPTIIISSQNDPDCNNGNNGTATVSASGGNGTLNYTWNTNPAQTGTTASNLSAGTYTANVTDANGCSASVLVTIGNPAAIIATVSITNANCAAADGSATVTATGGTGTLSYSWNTTPAQTTATASGLVPGSYSVTITDANGCSTAASGTVSTVGTANINAGPDQVIQLGGSAQLNATGGVNYTWSPSTGLSCSDCPDPIAAPTVSTMYTVTGTDANGCIGTDLVYVTIVPEPVECADIYVPTVLSPNGTGNSANKMICVYGGCVAELNFAIYNRWGEKVFETTDVTLMECWDGTFNGKTLNSGSFVYKLIVTLTNNEVIEESGNITLIR
jgi:gliding motility-associated-like protein